MYNYTPQVPLPPKTTSTDDDSYYANQDDKYYINYATHKGVKPTHTSVFLRQSENIYVVKDKSVIPTPANLGFGLWYFVRNGAPLLLVFFLFFISGFNPINALSAIYEDIRLSQNPKIVLGRVTELNKIEHMTSSHGKTSTHYTCSISYEFMANYKIYTSTEDVSCDFYDYGKKTLEIEYVENNPSISRPVGDSITDIEVFSAGGIIILLGFLGWLVTQYVKARSLCQNGQLVKGVLLGFDIRGNRKNGYKAIVDVNFNTPDGDIISKRIRYPIPREEKDSYVEEGTPIYIYYANKNNWKML